MPELPEVQTVVSTLSPLVCGMMIHAVRHLRADMVSPSGFDLITALKGQRITSVKRRAKRIVFTLANGHRFFIHLGMTGQLTAEKSDIPRRPHTHLIATLETEIELRLVDPRRFGAIVWLGETDHSDLGPEPLLLSARKLAIQLRGTKRAIKTALLDQRVVAGIGNIYADEALFRAGIHPKTPANELSPDAVRRLNLAIKYVLRRAIRAGGSSIRDYVDANGKKGDFQTKHAVYDRAGKPCLNCRSAITRIVLGGRSTCYCMKCQKFEAIAGPAAKRFR